MDLQNTEVHDSADGFPTQYPQNTKPLENQVAGHSFNDGHFTIGMLKHEEGYVLKPVNKPELGKKEISFYENVSVSTQPEVVQLKQFVPEYFGTVMLTIDGRSTQFMKLADATRGYRRPCVMDVKIGKQTWEPGAAVKKQLREEAKYSLCKDQCGFCIPGFHVYNVVTGNVDKYGKDHGKILQKENIPDVLKKFLNCDCGNSKVVGEEMLRQLNNILSWWRSQRTYHMYSSSVLLTYDADVLKTAEPSFCSVTNFLKIKTTEGVRVLLIDFAHVVPAHNTLDVNYFNGLETFVDIFMSVVNSL